jgi:hypothetical protein
VRIAGFTYLEHAGIDFLGFLDAYGLRCRFFSNPDYLVQSG